MGRKEGGRRMVVGKPTDLKIFLSHPLNQNQWPAYSLFLPTISGFHFANSSLE